MSGIGVNEGPTIEYTCNGCKFYDQERDGFGDYNKWCEHPEVTVGEEQGTKRNYLESYYTTTPHWCPYRISATK